ncbi:MAG: universal stress protein [Anaerolineales bacterium]|nr:universal stress protein [Anaerolineales bacterium]
MNKFDMLRSAALDFQQSRRRAQMEAVLSRLSGRPTELLPYEEIRKKLRLGTSVDQGVEAVPIDSIIGSVGRYQDFTRSFLPRHDSDRERWARVKAGVSDLSGLPPVELYRVGEAYFVLDGHHRISVAKQVGATHIEAYIREVPSRVSLTPETNARELILKYEYADFLYETGFDQEFPDVELLITEPGLYRALKEHIDVHRYYMGLDQEREIPYSEAVRHWYEGVYQPVIQVIQNLGVLQDFPNRTETDLYLWVADHRVELEEELGSPITTAAAVSDLASRKSLTPLRVASRIGNWLHDKLLPDAIESGPKPGIWREELGSDPQSSLFPSILVPLSELDTEWQALEQALFVASRENSLIHGIYVQTQEDRPVETIERLREGFNARLSEAGIEGQFVLEKGTISRTICDRARWNNLVVVYAAHPPADRPMDRLSSGLRMMIHRCPRPILVVPQRARPLNRILLAYNDSPKAQEALFVAAYFAGVWKCDLTVLSMAEKGRLNYNWLDDARRYLEHHQVHASFHHKFGSVPRVIERAAAQYHSDIILIGGYKASPITEVMLGSKVDDLMRSSDFPLLVCS